MKLRKRLEVQTTVKSWVGYFMEQNQISAAEMIDTLNATMVELKDLMYLEMLSENQEENNSNGERDL